jgi:lipopolysaccharide biosynthesis glycosyltransferase
VAPDQDYLNVILRGKIEFLNPVWNAEPVKDLPRNVKLVHFNLFNKPWHYKNVPCERIFWNAAKGTGFMGDLKRQQAAFDAEKQKAGKTLSSKCCKMETKGARYLCRHTKNVRARGLHAGKFLTKHSQYATMNCFIDPYRAHFAPRD